MSKLIEELWEDAGWMLTEESMRGYILAHFEQLYLGLRKIVAVNINIFGHNKGIEFLNKCCHAYKCRICWQDDGEYWIVHEDNPFFRPIPSRWSNNPEDHFIRGELLGYPNEVIKEYKLIKEGGGK